MEHLNKGDIVGIVSPAGFIKKNEDLSLAIKLLKRWGLQVKLGSNVFSKNNHFAGTDKERASDFQMFLDDKTIKAIWCTRGGYGSIRIVDKLDFSKYKINPKWIIGYSDITVFHHVAHVFNLESIHAVMPTSNDSLLNSDLAINSLHNALFGKELSYNLKPNDCNIYGVANGKIIGGNLSILASMLGSDYSLNLKSKILFIEEIGEYKYRIDSMLQSLKLNGYFKDCKGLIIGGFTNIKKNEPSFGLSIEDMILNTVKEYDFPVCFNFMAGHLTENHAIIFGREARLVVTKNKVSLSFYPIAKI